MTKYVPEDSTSTYSYGAARRTPIRWTWADSSARTAESVVAADVGHIGWQQDNDSLWVLSEETSPTWVQLGSSSDEKTYRSVCYNVFNATTAVGVSIGLAGFSIPAILDGHSLYDVVASVYDKGVTGSTTVMVRRRRAGLDVDMLSSALSLADDWYANNETINATNAGVQTGDILYIDVDSVHTTPPNGLSVTLTFESA